jgi:poly(beta-D-mannuronate) lyase
MRSRYKLQAFATLLILLSGPAAAKDRLVHDRAEFARAANDVEPGDAIVLADGIWRDFQIKFQADGAPGKPITLRAETEGKVILSGASNLRIGGDYLIVSGLVFRDGYSPNGPVIAFRGGSDEVANHSRLTRVVVDRFNQPDRRHEDHWVELYGQHNRVDHSHFEGKSNAGVTLAVIRRADPPIVNHHRIDHNYFGPRPPLGSNGGETIRIGTSEQSRSDSATIVESNVFDRCDGEVEIVSVKSGANIVRNNLILDSQGSIVLRHGNGNLVEGNVFLGHGKPHTGGIRVINAGQTVRGNYLEGVTGSDFVSALAVMNGVPNSPINRYDQVAGATIANNSFIDVRRITLGAGADAERSLPPTDSHFERNLIVNHGDKGIIRTDADVGGIAFAGNVQTEVATPTVQQGFARRPVELERAANGLLYPTDPALAGVGAPRTLTPIGKDEVGVPWYRKGVSARAAFGSGEVATVAPGGLAGAVTQAKGGDTLVLQAGDYLVPAPITIDRTLTIAGADKTPEPVIRFAAPTLFRIAEGGRLRLSGVTIAGDRAPSTAGNAVIRTAPGSMLANYVVEIADSRFTAMDGAPGFDLIATAPSQLAGYISITGSDVDGLSGTVVAAHTETGDKGWYNVERVAIERSHFRNVGEIADIFRGGRDESTFGPQFRMTGSTVANSGKVAGASIRLSGVQVAEIADDIFTDSAPIRVTHSVGTPRTRIANNRFSNTPGPVIRELYYRGPQRAELAGNSFGSIR